MSAELQRMLHIQQLLIDSLPEYEATLIVDADGKPALSLKEVAEAEIEAPAPIVVTHSKGFNMTTGEMNSCLLVYNTLTAEETLYTLDLSPDKLVRYIISRTLALLKERPVINTD